MTRAERTCSTCGGAVPMDVAFCGHCGADASQAEEPAPFDWEVDVKLLTNPILRGSFILWLGLFHRSRGLSVIQGFIH